VLHDSANSEELPYPAQNAPRPVVRPQFIRWLAIDPETAPHIDPEGLRVYGFTIPGYLDLENCRVHMALDFQRCRFKGEIYFQYAETGSISLIKSSFEGGITADGISAGGDFSIEGSNSFDKISLMGAEIRGDLDCSGAKLSVKEGPALSFDRAQIDGNAFFNDGFESEDEIRLLGAEIKGNLDCTGAKLKAKGKHLAWMAQRLAATSSLVMASSLRARFV
jgi:hypothetical protein